MARSHFTATDQSVTVTSKNFLTVRESNMVLTDTSQILQSIDFDLLDTLFQKHLNDVPTKRKAAPTKRKAAPTKRKAAPTKRATAPAKRATAPTKRKAAPAKRATAPTKRKAAPVKCV